MSALYWSIALSTTVFALGCESTATAPTKSGASITDVCKAAQTCPAVTASDCQRGLNADGQKADAAGCAREWGAMLNCLESHPEDCLQTTKSCNTQSVALAACEVGPVGECKVDDRNAPSSCSVSCAQSGASCSGGIDGLSCTCTQGPNAGKAFAVKACSAITEVSMVQCS